MSTSNTACAASFNAFCRWRPAQSLHCCCCVVGPRVRPQGCRRQPPLQLQLMQPRCGRDQQPTTVVQTPAAVVAVAAAAAQQLGTRLMCRRQHQEPAARQQLQEEEEGRMLGMLRWRGGRSSAQEEGPLVRRCWTVLQRGRTMTRQHRVGMRAATAVASPAQAAVQHERLAGLKMAAARKEGRNRARPKRLQSWNRTWWWPWNRPLLQSSCCRCRAMQRG